MYEIGWPGGYVTKQKRLRLQEGALYGAGTAALAAVSLCSLVSTVTVADPALLRGLTAVTAAGTAAGCRFTWTRTARALRQARRYAIGARSELEVRKAVRRTASIAAAYELMLGGRGGDCDVVVFTRDCGAAAVEVKTGHGKVEVEDGAMRVGRRVLHGSPVRQAANQARKVSRRLGRKAVLAVVCVPGMTNRPFVVAGVWVCGTKDLGPVLAQAPRVFASAAEAERTMERLGRASPGQGGTL
ncbi:nuclease-related domain-containing protein [Actinomadura sp. B10D3]|uniref:nuclease-related domain-containing protein n=1 Tax=Actinomadura sp. B10D3 TaxID=3153557 RepID=UPI00325F008F